MPEPRRRDESIARRADTLALALRNTPGRAALDEAGEMLDELRKIRDFARLETLAELISRYRPGDLRARRLLAQSLTEQGSASVAVDVASAARRRARECSDPELDELCGVLGRAYKQIFVDDPSAVSAAAMSEGARVAIEQSIAAYREAWERDKGENCWHGVNLAAMAHVAETRHIRLATPLDKAEIAGEVIDALEACAGAQRDSWWHASKAEAHIARREWEDADAEIRAYVSADGVSAFNFASTLRQFRDVWQIQDMGAAGLDLIQMLEATYLERNRGGGDSAEEKPPLLMSAAHVRQVRSAEAPSEEHLQRVLGKAKTQTLRWYRTGLDRAASVAAIREILGKRVGTGFAVRGADVGLGTEEVFVLTNFHVVNIEGASPGLKPADAEVVFEAEDARLEKPYEVAEVIAESPERGGLDFSLLRLSRPVRTIPGVPLSNRLPAPRAEGGVYVIGHAGGHELQFSLQDNRVIDHEGPPHGSPPRADRLRIHYFAPTERGSSGSPVFDKRWKCIALHHAGAKHDPPPAESGMRMLNGKTDFYSANEGICMQSIRNAIAATVR